MHTYHKIGFGFLSAFFLKIILAFSDSDSYEKLQELHDYAPIILIGVFLALAGISIYFWLRKECPV